MIEFDDAGEVMQELLRTVKETCVYFSYGEFDGLRVPSKAELYVLRGLIDGAIEEIKNEDSE